MEKNSIIFIQKKIILWYEKNGRSDLPWRHTSDPYHIAIAEVMLQQTNVPKVIDKFIDFIKRFPTVRELSSAAQKDVLVQWKGLGYNRRAIYLHRMAKSIMNEWGGIFPRDPEILISLPGVGPYTSRSIPIFAQNDDIAACDVNIARILRRIHKSPAANDAQVKQWAETYLYRGRSRDWHNALMDFASIVCTKRSPQCEYCPIKKKCLSFPYPQDERIQKRCEVGRKENGKHIPRRIFRGRIVDYLRNHQSGTIDQIGLSIKKDWHGKNDRIWCEHVLQGLMKDDIVMRKKDLWMLQ